MAFWPLHPIRVYHRLRPVPERADSEALKQLAMQGAAIRLKHHLQPFYHDMQRTPQMDVRSSDGWLEEKTDPD